MSLASSWVGDLIATPRACAVATPITSMATYWRVWDRGARTSTSDDIGGLLADRPIDPFGHAVRVLGAEVVGGDHLGQHAQAQHLYAHTEQCGRVDEQRARADRLRLHGPAIDQPL